MSLVTDLFFPVLLLNQRWSPPLRLQASHCSTFRITCHVPSTAVFCSESIECFPGTASRFFLKLLVTIPVAPIITGIIVHFRFHIRCISIHKLLYFNFIIIIIIIIIINKTTFGQAWGRCEVHSLVVQSNRRGLLQSRKRGRMANWTTFSQHHSYSLWPKHKTFCLIEAKGRTLCEQDEHCLASRTEWQQQNCKCDEQSPLIYNLIIKHVRTNKLK